MLADPKREAEIEFEIKVAKEPERLVLLGAAVFLEERGWCRGWEDALGRRCALGAISYVARGAEYMEAACRLHDYINKNGGRRQNIATWNDANDAETVIATLEAAARE